MYRRFLNNNDYLGIISPEALQQLTRGNEERFIQAEECAEMSIREYLSENYEIDKEFAKGKFIARYDRQISYPVGAHIYFEDKIYEVIRSLSGYKVPSNCEYWEECFVELHEAEPARFSQFETYQPGDKVTYNGVAYVCVMSCGYKFNDVRIPMVHGWSRAVWTEWQYIAYNLWEVVEFEGAFYTLVSLDGYDPNEYPVVSDCWGEIADYDPAYNQYELCEHEYVVYENDVYYPEMDVNSDEPKPGVSLSLHDPRNYNLKKHMVRMAIYELTKIIAPNNVSLIRVKDYEESMKWLSDVSKLRINPQIPRKVATGEKPVMDWQMATFQTDYNPGNNPWLV